MRENSPVQHQSNLQKAAFLDRDGVINIDSSEYVTRPEDFVFIEDSPQAVKRLYDAGFALFITTNQSAMSRGTLTEQNLHDIHEKMKAGIAAVEARFTDIYYCPHLPEDDCECRKPKPGMIMKAVNNHSIDLSASVMIGDRAKDIESGRNAGCRYTILINSGMEKDIDDRLQAAGVTPDYTADTLALAVDWLLRRYPEP